MIRIVVAGLLALVSGAYAAEPDSTVMDRGAVEARAVIQGAKNTFFRAVGRLTEGVTQAGMPASYAEIVSTYGFALTAPGYEIALQAVDAERSRLCIRFSAPSAAAWMGFVDGSARAGARAIGGGCGGSPGLSVPTGYPYDAFAVVELDRRRVPLANVVPPSVSVDVAGVAYTPRPVGSAARLVGSPAGLSDVLEIGLTNNTSLPLTLEGLKSTPGFSAETDCTDVLPAARCVLSLRFDQAAVGESTAGRVWATAGGADQGLSLTLDGRFRR